MSVTNQPAVSVILPNYNHARFLPDRLNSILNQTFSQFELILLDDCSTDHSRQILSEVSDPRITHRIFNTENSGSPFAQWNRGVQLARAPLIWIAESDDLCDATFLEKLVPYFDGHPDLALVYCQSAIIDSNGSVAGSQLGWTADFGSDRWNTGFVADGSAEISQYLLRKSTIPNASAVVFRRDLFPSDLAFSRFRQTGDTLIWCLIIAGKQLRFLPDSLNLHRHHQETVRAGTSRSRRLIDIIRLSLELERRLGLTRSDRNELIIRIDSLAGDMEKERVFPNYFFPLLLSVLPHVLRQPYFHTVGLVLKTFIRFFKFRIQSRLGIR
ncbi:MAG: glycosyltransferase family 2 protein [Bacteroidetes bacterium]|nr:glycosyltransferase family 2 protein [Bacteroidota bacterium]